MVVFISFSVNNSSLVYSALVDVTLIHYHAIGNSCYYSGTCLMRSPGAQKYLALLDRWLYYRKPLKAVM